MLSSFTSKFRTLLFNEDRSAIDQEFSRKRKRCDDDRDDGDDDVIITAIKRPKVEEQSLFSRVIVSPYSKMAEWVKSKSKWKDMHFFRKYNKHDPWKESSEIQNFKETPRNGRKGNTGTRNSNGPRLFFENRQMPRQNMQHSVPTQTDDSSLVNGVHGINGDTESNASGGSQGHHGKLRRIFTVKECVRLDEKEQYRQLLQQFTSVPIIANPEEQQLIRSHNGSIQWSDENILGGNVSSTLPPLPPGYKHTRKRPPDSVRERVMPTVYGAHVQKWHISPIEVMKSATFARNKAPVVTKLVKPQLKENRKDTHLKSKAVDVMETTNNSRKDSSCKFPDCQFLSDDWMDSILSKYSTESRERHRKIAEEEIKAKVYEERRIAREENLEKEIRHRMRILSTEPAVAEEPQIEDIEEKEDVLPELTDEMLEEVNMALRPGNPDQVLSEGFRIRITRKDISTLSGLNWLNDEIINFYMNLLMERGEQEGQAKVYAFNTFFYPKVMSVGHSAVRRWTKKVDVFSMDYIIVPVHLGMHWCLCVVDFKKKLVQYYDSMGGQNVQCLNAMRNYLCEESLDKKKTKFDLTGWSTLNAEVRWMLQHLCYVVVSILDHETDIPQQMNGSDCGMFACKYAEYITRGADITFTQADMPYFRKRMVYEILKKKLLQ